MSERQISIILAVIIAVLGIALFVKLSGISIGLISHDYSISLPDGYSIIRSSSEDIALNYFSTIEVEPTIDGYRVYRNVLVGHTVKPSPNTEDKSTKPGYFIVVFKRGETRTGLSREQWIKELSRLGIRSVPTLHRPTGLDQLLGYNKPS